MSARSNYGVRAIYIDILDPSLTHLLRSSKVMEEYIIDYSRPSSY